MRIIAMEIIVAETGEEAASGYSRFNIALYYHKKITFSIKKKKPQFMKTAAFNQFLK